MTRETARELIARLAETRRLSSRARDTRVLKNKLAAEPVVRELRAAGFDVEWIADLRHFVADYTAAIPILVKWLPIVENPAVKSDIVRSLSLTSQKWLAPLLIKEYRQIPADTLAQRDLRVAVANALEVLADDAIFDDIAEMAQDKRMGPSRSFLVLALSKMATLRAVAILTSLLDDADVCVAAITSLGKLRAVGTQERIATFLGSDVAEAVAAAKTALARMNKRKVHSR